MPSEKKRKRPAGDSHKSSRKRQSVTFENDTLKISVVNLKALNQAPALAIPIGLSVPHLPLKAYSRKDEETVSSQHELVLHSSEHPRLDFIAEEDSGCDSLLKHYVGVYDPASGEVKLIPTRRLALRSTLRPSQEELAQASGKAYQTMSTMRQNLGMEFGTKQAKKMITSLAENAIITAGGSAKPSIASKAFLESIAQNVANLPTIQEMEAAAEAAKPKPRANLSATVPKDVYPIDTLVDDYTLQEIPVDDWIEATAGNEGVTTTSRYVSRRLASIIQNKDTMKLKVLKYIWMVIELFQSLTKTRHGMKIPRSEGNEEVKHPPHLIGNIRKRFSNSPSEMTLWEVDNMITHVLAMSLYIDDYRCDVIDLKDDFRLEQQKISSYFHELGCKIGTATDKEKASLKLTGNEAKIRKIARLEIPLEFPQDKGGRTGRKKY